MKPSLLFFVTCCAVAPLLAAPVERKFSYVELASKANRKLADNQGSGIEGNHLKEVPIGERAFASVKFRVGAGLIQLGSKLDFMAALPDKVEGIEVGRACTKLHMLHATCFGGGPNQPDSGLFVEDGTLIGEYRINFEDRTALIVPVVYGQDVRDWFYVEGEREPSRGKVAWSGDNDRAKQVGARIRLYVSSWDNPWPRKKVTTIDFLSKKGETVAAPFCVALTIEEK
jgi:hypothetical protein